MLRLRPSEITLTAADVDETRRRMARRQAATPSAGLSARSCRLPPRPPQGPRLRRGPDRPRDDAVKHLVDVAVQKPQQVAHASVDDEDNATWHPEASPRNNDRVRASREAVRDGNGEPSTPSPVRNLQLPFRPPPGPDLLDSQRPLFHSNAGNQVSLSPEPLSGSPSSHQSKPHPSEDHSPGLSRSLIPSSIDGSTEDTSASSPRGSSTTLTQTPRQHNGNSYPVDQLQTDVRARQYRGRGLNGGLSQLEDAPTLYLQGYFETPQRYRFKELLPHTDPPQRSSRLAARIRAMSSSSDPLQLKTGIDEAALAQDQASNQNNEQARRTSTEAPEARDIFEQSGERQPRSSFDERMRIAHSRAESIQERCRTFFSTRREHQNELISASSATAAGRHTSQRFSEASSNSSLPYSYYELPGSRHSSSHSHGENGEHLQHSQYDGAAPSRQVSRGAYFSIRPSQVRAANEARSRPHMTRYSSFSSPDLAGFIDQRGLSPLPTNPYTRGHNSQSSLSPSMGLVTVDDFGGDGQDAASAAQRDLISPLELLGQRAAAQLARVRTTMPALPSHELPPGNASVFQYEVDDFNGQEPHRRRATGSESMRQVSGNAVHYRTAAPSRHPTEVPITEMFHHRAERATIVPRDRQRSRQRSRQRTSNGRAGQRSSENVPVGTASVHEPRAASRMSQGRGQRVGFGRLEQHRSSQGAGLRGGELLRSPPVRFSLPTTASPHENSNRDPERSPRHFRMRRAMHNYHQDDAVQSSSLSSPSQDTSQRGFQHHAPRSFRGPTDLRTPHVSSSHHSTSPQSLDLPRFLVHPPPPSAYDSFRRNPHHSPIPTPPVPNNRRPPIPLRVASRRISAHQENQENSEEVQHAMMRDEMQAASMRYADSGVGQDIMDETPPRVGRLERAGHMVIELRRNPMVGYA